MSSIKRTFRNLKDKDKFKRILFDLQKSLIVGVLSLSPILICFWIIGELYDYFRGAFVFVLGKVDSFSLSFLIFWISVLFITFVGIKVRSFEKIFLLTSFENFMLKIPLLGFIIKTFKELTKMFYSFDDSSNYLGVVKVPFNNGKTLGLITSVDEEKEEYTVFIPTAPNPTSGFVMYYSFDECDKLDMEIKDVFRVQLSLGTQK